VTFAADLARARPEELALRDPTSTWSWAEVDDWLRPAVTALQDLDLGPERRVAILATNSAQTVLAYVACTLAGASAVAVNSHLTSSETAFILSNSDARAVLCDTTTAEVAAAAARDAGIATVAAWGDGPLPDGVRTWASFCDEDREPVTDIAPRRTLVYTSGTTGRPKGVELPPTSWVGGADIVEHLAGLAQNPMVGHGRHLAVGPLYHSGPLTATRLLAGGAPVTVLDKFDADALLTAIERDRIASSIMVPTHFQRLLALPTARRHAADISSLRFVLQVGAACPEPVKRAMIDWWGAERLFESYGASEVGTTCMISAVDWLEHPGSVGQAVPPFEAFVRQLDGSPAAPGTEGQLWFRDTSGHGIRYLSGQGSNGAEFTLGEIGRMDADGFVWITDRFSDMVVSGGVNIYPAEVEQALVTHRDVADVACFGVPDEEFGERLVALVVPADPAAPPSEAELKQHVRTLVAGYKVPKVFQLTDSLPRTAVGKLDKRTMRRMKQPEPETGAAR
jgi:long-chain acyl-CoA synthetase